MVIYIGIKATVSMPDTAGVPRPECMMLTAATTLLCDVEKSVLYSLLIAVKIQAVSITLWQIDSHLYDIYACVRVVCVMCEFL